MALSYSTYKTVLRNASGAAKFFAYLPPHGATLAAEEEVTVDGDLFSMLSALVRPAKKDAFIADINAGNIEVVSTPSIILEDATTGASKVVELNNGSLVLDEPVGGSVGGT